MSFYGTTGWSPGPPDPFAYRVDLADTLSPVTRKTFPDGSPLQLVPSLDEKKWFLYLKFSTFGCLFAVYDTLTDSIIFRDYLTPGTGDLELTPNGRYVFYTNPGTMLDGPQPPFSFTAYDVEKNEIHRVISTIGVFDEPYDVGVPVGEICITPDGRWLVAIMTGGYNYVFAMDIENMNIDRYKLGYGIMLHGLACQNSP
jgi:DNA-binding beta-propeller fold protein YncE